MDVAVAVGKANTGAAAVLGCCGESEREGERERVSERE